MKNPQVVVIGGSNGIGRLLAEKMRAEGVGLVVTVAPRSPIEKVAPNLAGMCMVDPRQHDKKCWKDAKRYGRK